MPWRLEQRGVTLTQGRSRQNLLRGAEHPRDSDAVLTTSRCSPRQDRSALVVLELVGFGCRIDLHVNHY